MATDDILADPADLEALGRLHIVGNSKAIDDNAGDVRLPFEKNFDDVSWTNWMVNYWWLSLVASLIYVVAIFAIQHWMRSKQQLDLRRPLIAWNVFLAVFSIFGTYRSLKAMYYTLAEGGWHESVCDLSNQSYTHNKITGAWALLFVFSKVVEFGDTLFIVFRKGNLIFLHWYHHITVLMYVCISYKEHASTGYWFMVLNFPVHSVMYSYYAMRAAKIRVSKSLSMWITAMQLIQMIAGCAIQYYVYYGRTHGWECRVTPFNNLMGSLMYISYLLLFAHFFYNAYMAKAPRRQVKQE